MLKNVTNSKNNQSNEDRNNMMKNIECLLENQVGNNIENVYHLVENYNQEYCQGRWNVKKFNMFEPIQSIFCYNRIKLFYDNSNNFKMCEFS